MYVKIFLTILLLSFVSVAYSSDNKVSGKHLENDITCVDCHDTENPVKRASAKVCKTCHDGVVGDNKTYSENGKLVQVNPHEPHVGEIRCTVCHSTHSTSTLYCNESCHFFSDMIVK